MNNKIELKPIKDLHGMNFLIPSYQRGYRWTKQQVEDLLEDVQEFIVNGKDEFYCIQPLVVKKREQETLKLIKEANSLDEVQNLLKGSWEVIDGQQRLTTIYILLSCLKPTNLYTIEYETREDSKLYLKDVNPDKRDNNIDYFHIAEAKEQIDKWFKQKTDIQKNTFLENLSTNVKFIWYESVAKDSIKVFTRLNVGKISLTNAELIKALFLNKSNFGKENNSVRLQQQEIALEWDKIEYTLQNEEFWLFINSCEYEKHTRIDLIFDLIVERNSFNLTNGEYKKIGNDEDKTFRYFDAVFKKSELRNIEEYWDKVKRIFQIFEEWFSDIRLFHYVGYLLSEVNGHKISKLQISELINEWEKPSNTKKDFIEYLIEEIKETLKPCKNLDEQYELKGKPKTRCRPILLLHNIQTIVNQNISLVENEKYKLPVFYKFPFHLLKKESWDVEHIDSNAANELTGKEDQNEWLKYASMEIEDKSLRNRIMMHLQNTVTDNEITFESLYQEIDNNHLRIGKDNSLSEDEKNQLWNFALLDSSTNRSYGNSPFPAKRRILIGKDQGVKYKIGDNLEITPEKANIAFVPLCTKNVFLKYFNHSTNSLREWDKADAMAYRENIKKVLKDFLEEEEEYYEQE